MDFMPSITPYLGDDSNSSCHDQCRLQPEWEKPVERKVALPSCSSHVAFHQMDRLIGGAGQSTHSTWPAEE